MLASQGDFDGAQPSALRISSGFTFGPFPQSTILMTAVPGAPGAHTIEIGFDDSPVANSLVPSGQITNFTYITPEPATSVLLTLGLAALAMSRRLASRHRPRD